MDATALVSAAAALETHTEVLVARAHHLARQCAAMRWNSPAADRCRTALGALCNDLIASGTAAMSLADRMRASAARVARAR
jgi:hypothetical protein